MKYAVAWLLALAGLSWLAGCGPRRETPRSRAILECVYAVQYQGPKLPPAAETAAIKGCQENAR